MDGTGAVGPRRRPELRVEALRTLEGTMRLVEAAVGAAHGPVAPPLAVQETAARPHVLCDEEGLWKSDTRDTREINVMWKRECRTRSSKLETDGHMQITGDRQHRSTVS